MKETKDLFDENYKSEKKETEENIRRWDNLQYSWISRINILKSEYYTKSNLHVQGT
jgi:hypothetical protein